jgi:hypothetical protein
MARKGKKVHFIGGKYGGKKGWVNDDRNLGTGTIPVIVDLGKKGEKETYVYEYIVWLSKPRQIRPAMLRQLSNSAPTLNALLPSSVETLPNAT